MFGNKNQPKPDLESFILFDSKVGNYRLPMFAINKFDIIRQVESLFTDPEQARNQLVTNAEDFAIFKNGDYNKSTGVFTPCVFEHIANLHDIKASVQKPQGALSST